MNDVAMQNVRKQLESLDADIWELRQMYKNCKEEFETFTGEELKEMDQYSDEFIEWIEEAKAKIQNASTNLCGMCCEARRRWCDENTEAN